MCVCMLFWGHATQRGVPTWTRNLPSIFALAPGQYTRSLHSRPPLKQMEIERKVEQSISCSVVWKYTLTRRVNTFLKWALTVLILSEACLRSALSEIVKKTSGENASMWKIATCTQRAQVCARPCSSTPDWHAGALHAVFAYLSSCCVLLPVKAFIWHEREAFRQKANPWLWENQKTLVHPLLFLTAIVHSHNSPIGNY